MANMSPEARHLLKLLDDGEWHDYGDIRAKLAAAIAPGKALRRFDTISRNMELHNGPRRGPEPTDDTKIASGQASIALDVLNSMKKRHVEIVEDADGNRRIRRREEPLPFGAPASAPDPPTPVSQAAPTPAGPPPGDNHAMAFFSEAAVRAIVRDEIHLAFESFRTGLQSWLGIKLADISRRRFKGSNAKGGNGKGARGGG